MRILISGGAGFIGSHVADAYLSLGHEVAVLDNLATGSLDNLDAGAKFFQADITDLPRLQQIFGEFRPDVVSHHAAQISVVDSIESPAYDAGINVVGSLNVWQCARDCGARRFIFASSGGAIYGQVETSPVPEEQPANPMSPYGLSKWAFERYLTLLHGFSAPTPVILRYANVYGPRQGRQGEAGVISIFGRRLLEEKPCVIFGDGSMTRDYVFVKDVVKANCQALERGDGGIFNIGTGQQVSTLELYGMMEHLAAKGAQNPQFAPQREGEVLRIALECERAAATLGWKPETPIVEGLKQVMAAMKSA
ncbi:MAG: NAD-dependent epimerase/dehydratase family protein [Armatimonadetes bacterium]|nr:NAD-dependent epimerase/dehydratase family protein [Armatimonadota bacterium]